MSFLIGPAAAGWVLQQPAKVVSGAAVTSVTFSGLDGDADGGVYWFVGRVFNAIGTAINVELIPQGSWTSASDYQRLQVSSTTVAGTRLADASAVINLSGSKDGIFSCMFWAETGTLRGYIAHGLSDMGATLANNHFSGSFDDTSTNITSAQFLATTALAIDVGSEFRIFKLAG